MSIMQDNLQPFMKHNKFTLTYPQQCVHNGGLQTTDIVRLAGLMCRASPTRLAWSLILKELLLIPFWYYSWEELKGGG